MVHIISCALSIFSVLGRGRRVGIFVSKGGIGILLHILTTTSKESPPSDELMLHLHSLLALVGPKGKFNVTVQYIPTQFMPI